MKVDALRLPFYSVTVLIDASREAVGDESNAKTVGVQVCDRAATSRFRGKSE